MEGLKHRAACLTVLLVCAACGPVGYRTGDIIFQESKAYQSKFVEVATGSRYTHCGIVIRKGLRVSVIEAVGPVKETPLDEWIEEGVDGHYVVKRLRGEKELTGESAKRVIAVARTFTGRPYDHWFMWDDTNLYCSELVWKAYERGAGIRLCEPRKLRSYQLKGLEEELQRRYARDVPLDEAIVAPSDVMESALLRDVSRR